MATWTVGGRGQVPGVLGACLMHLCGGFPSFRPASDRILCLALVLVTARALKARGERGMHGTTRKAEPPRSGWRAASTRLVASGDTIPWGKRTSRYERPSSRSAD